MFSAAPQTCICVGGLHCFKVRRFKSELEPFCMEFACFPRACVGFLCTLASSHITKPWRPGWFVICKLSVGMSVHGSLFLHGYVNQLEPVQALPCLLLNAEWMNEHIPCYIVWYNVVSFSSRVHITEATLKHLNKAYEVEEGNGHLRDPYLNELNVKTYLVIDPRVSYLGVLDDTKCKWQ